jgi:hypothetical protein
LALKKEKEALPDWGGSPSRNRSAFSRFLKEKKMPSVRPGGRMPFTCPIRKDWDPFGAPLFFCKWARLRIGIT